MYFKYRVIGVDSVMPYVKKIHNSSSNLDKAFAFAAERQLLNFKGEKYDEKFYLNKIDYFLKQNGNNESNLDDLFNIYNTSGWTFATKKEYHKALKRFIIAEEYAIKAKNDKNLIIVKINIIVVKADLKKFDEALIEIKKVDKIIKDKNGDKDFEESNLKNKLNLGKIYIDKYTETKKIVYCDSAINTLKPFLKIDNDYYKAWAYSKLALCYNELKNYKLSDNYSDESINLFEKLEDKTQVLNEKFNKSLNLFHAKNYINSKKMFHNIIKIEDKKHFNYIFSHKYLSEILLEQKNDSAKYYLNTFLKLYENQNEAEKIEMANVYKDLENKDLKEEVVSVKKVNSTYLIAILIIICTSVIIFYFLINRKRKTQQKFDSLIEKLNNSKKESNIKIKEEEETKILSGLIKLENRNYFLNQDFSLYNVAKKIGTNTSYLSAIMNKHKGKSFVEYTNDLRVNYIVTKLQDEPKIRKYTIAAIAEMVGYKNGTSFTKIFKEKTGLSPLQFIEKLK